MGFLQVSWAGCDSKEARCGQPPFQDLYAEHEKPYNSQDTGLTRKDQNFCSFLFFSEICPDSGQKNFQINMVTCQDKDFGWGFKNTKELFTSLQTQSPFTRRWLLPPAKVQKLPIHSSQSMSTYCPTRRYGHGHILA